MGPPPARERPFTFKQYGRCRSPLLSQFLADKLFDRCEGTNSLTRSIEHALNLRPGELRRGLPLFAYLFLVMSAYVTGRVVRDTLFLSRFHHGRGDRTIPEQWLVKGIGSVLAKKLVGRFGAEVLTVIETRTAELQSVDGIGPKRRERIAHAWQEAKQVREIMLFLHSHGVSTSRAVRIFKTYGEQAIERVRENPHTLAKDVYGIGFATADQIAQKVGIPKDSK